MNKIFAIALLLVLIAGAIISTRVMAQEATVNLYLVPIEIVPRGTGQMRGPKYLAWAYDPDPPGLTYRWGMMDYGFTDYALLAVSPS